MKGTIAILVLAAGPSSRMGQSKQELLIDGKSLLVRAVETAVTAGADHVAVVLGSQHKAHRELLKNDKVEIVFNEHWHKGMGSSLKAGLSHLLATFPETRAMIVMVCDQPLLRSHHIRSLIEKYRESRVSIIASAYSGTLGVPVLFDKQLFAEILELPDEHGAKKIIERHPSEVVDFPEGSTDLDTPEEYQNFLRLHSKNK